MKLDPVAPKYTPTEPDVVASLYVDGRLMKKGWLKQLNLLFEDECTQHAASVELRVNDGQLTQRTVRRRARQQ